MEQHIFLAALVFLAIVLGLTIVVLVRRQSDLPPGSWATEKAAIENELAIAKERAARVAALEQTLSDVRNAREHADREVAKLGEAKVHLEANSQKKDEELQRLTDTINEANRQITSLKTDLAGTQEALNQERRQASEKLKVLLEAKDSMTTEFKVLANELMSQHGDTFKKQNKEQLDTLLLPLREKLKEYQDGLQKAHEETGRERATLAEQIRQLSERSAEMSAETINLTRALKGSAQMQGAWGEMVLETLLQKSGLRDGEEYVRQESHNTETGGRLRTDVIVNLPGGQRVIIDSKLSLLAFESYVNEENDDAREVQLVAHLGSMRNHIRSLSSKEYHATLGGNLDYVIMFVPIEGALAVALQKDPSLTGYAVQSEVMIATPTTLMIALRTIENVWKVERRNQNAEAIADRAGLIYNKLVGFIEDMQEIGQRLEQARRSHLDAMGKLQIGSGNLIGQAEKLKELGARTTKSLPKGIIVDDGSSQTPVVLIASEVPQNEMKAASETP